MDETSLGEPSVVLVEFAPTQIFSSLDKALAFVKEVGCDPAYLTVREAYFTPVGTVHRDINIELSEDDD